MIAIKFYVSEIKLEKFKEAVDDCDRVLIAEPKNVKGMAMVTNPVPAMHWLMH